jgi:hypothetical protein
MSARVSAISTANRSNVKFTPDQSLMSRFMHGATIYAATDENATR